MTYDEKLAERIRRVLPPTSAIAEKKMFGGLAFLLDGKMFVGVAGVDLMVRVGAEVRRCDSTLPCRRLVRHGHVARPGGQLTSLRRVAGTRIRDAC